MDLEQLNLEIVDCHRCPRLVEWREKVAHEKRKAYKDQAYWGKPVPGFGDPNADVFVVGLAPGAHGSNRTGRQFTGDGSGDFLFPALHRFEFASQPNSISRDDGLLLIGLYTAPVCRCAPPANKPTSQEIANCRPYLEREIELIKPKVFVSLGKIAFETIKSIFQIKEKIPFVHGAVYPLRNDYQAPWLVTSYHPSRQNTQTGRLTEVMFDKIWETTRNLLERR